MTGVRVVGDAIVDAVFDGVDRYPDPGEEVLATRYDLRPGGSGGYASLGLAALGADVRVTTVVGSDPLSEYWVGSLADAGVDTSGIERVPGESASVAAAFLGEDDRSFVTYRGAVAAERTVVPEMAGADAVLVTGFSQAPYLWSDALVESVRDAGVPVFLDTNWSPGDWQETVDELLPAVDYLLVNDTEATRLAGAGTVEAAGAELLDRGVGACAITAGAEGCVLVTDDGVERVGVEAVEAVDDCGAGDFFSAGLVVALSDSAALPEAARFGNRCARAAVGTFELQGKLAAMRDLEQSP